MWSKFEFSEILLRADRLTPHPPVIHFFASEVQSTRILRESEVGFNVPEYKISNLLKPLKTWKSTSFLSPLPNQFLFSTKRLLSALLFRYWFSEDQMTQYIPFCTPIISSYQITRVHYDNIIIKNGHFSQRRINVGWCKWHDEFRIATSL